MGSVIQSAAALTAITNTFMYVIEGGTPNGTIYYPGVPAYGFEEDDELIGGLTGVSTVTAAAGSNTTQIVTATDHTLTHPKLATKFGPSSGGSYEKLYPGFLVGQTAPNAGVVRRIEQWVGTTITVYGGASFPYTVSVADTFQILLGFRRAPDNIDLDSPNAGAPNAWDRFYTLNALPGRRIGWYGNGIEHYETELELTVRFLKKSRARRVMNHALTNMFALRAVLAKPSSRDHTKYIQTVSTFESEPDIVLDDAQHIVVRDRFQLTYRVDTTHL